MFHAIRRARMAVGAKSVAALSSGYLHALAYARQRRQGSDLSRAADPTAPQVVILQHPDIRRSLMLQKAYAEGLRSLVLLAASCQDRADAARHAEDELEWERAQARADLLLPVVKGCCSERSVELLCSETLQVFGGSGYLRGAHPAEHYLRDTRIDSVYEGTTAIQSLDLLLRRVIKDNGQALHSILDDLEATASAAQAGSARAAEGAALAEAGAHVRWIFDVLRSAAAASATRPTELYLIGLHSRRALLALGDVLVGWLLLRQADIAEGRLAQPCSPAARDFYRAKRATCRFFIMEVLPRLGADRVVVECGDASLMDVAPAQFGPDTEPC
jgi:hypothetical protein